MPSLDVSQAASIFRTNKHGLDYQTHIGCSYRVTWINLRELCFGLWLLVLSFYLLRNTHFVNLYTSPRISASYHRLRIVYPALAQAVNC
jgi:hypothetical protein